MVSDSEPRYRLEDSNGNIVGSLFAEADGTLKLQEGTSGSDNELALGTDGTFTTDRIETGPFQQDSTAVIDLSDDTATSISTPSAENNNVMLWVTTTSGDCSGIFQSAFGTINDAALGSNITNQGNFTTLTGTDGPDGSLNVSKDGTDLYLENRTDSTIDVYVWEMA